MSTALRLSQRVDARNDKFTVATKKRLIDQLPDLDIESLECGTFYATETAAIFEHETFFELCREVCERRGHTYEGSLIKRFHDIHLDEGVEQGHKDGLAAFVDVDPSTPAPGEGEQINQDDLEQGAYAAIDAMQVWWDAMLDKVLKPVPQR